MNDLTITFLQQVVSLYSKVIHHYLDSNSKFLGGRGRVMKDIFSMSDMLFRLSMVQTVQMVNDSSVAGGRFSSVMELIGLPLL